MSTRQNYTTKRLFLRSLTPSAVSFLLCGLFGFIVVASNIVLLSVTIGTALPSVLDGQWAIAYTQNVVQPLSTFLANNAFNKSLVALLWGSAGFIAYVAFEYSVHWSKTLKQARNDVQMARGRIVEHPLKDEFWKSVRWRGGVIIAAVMFFIAMQPLLNNASSVASEFVVSKQLATDSLRVVLAILEWALFWHGCVVLLRLFTLRTRMFGDDKLY